MFYQLNNSKSLNNSIGICFLYLQFSYPGNTKNISVPFHVYWQDNIQRKLDNPWNLQGKVLHVALP